MLALQAEEPMLTLLALLAPELCCTSQAEEPMLTLLAYELPFTLDVELG